MIYITVKLPRMYHQMSFEDFLFRSDTEEFKSYVGNYKETATRTYEVSEISEKFAKRANVYYMIKRLKAFNAVYEKLEMVEDKSTMYRRFYEPKKSGGLRPIDAPNPELDEALRVLKSIFENDFGALYHTSAFAYMKKRSFIDGLKKHTANNSKWYGKYDLHNFFGSITMDYMIHILEMIFPFNLVLRDPIGKQELVKALSLAFLNGGLPQGTPISPMLSNLVMIPIDYKMTQALRDFGKQKFIYSRYADDFLISSVYDFNFRKVEKLLLDTLAYFGAPFTLNREKTRYGSNAGRNWNFGLMITADNKITIGHKKKKQFETMLFNYAMDNKKGISWPKEDVQHLEGLRAYYHMVEGEVIDNIVNHISEKTNVNIINLIKTDLGRK